MNTVEHLNPRMRVESPLEKRSAFCERLGITADHASQPQLDRICKTVSQSLEVPIALASFVVEDRQMFGGMWGTLRPRFHVSARRRCATACARRWSSAMRNW